MSKAFHPTEPQLSHPEKGSSCFLWSIAAQIKSAMTLPALMVCTRNTPSSWNVVNSLGGARRTNLPLSPWLQEGTLLLWTLSEVAAAVCCDWEVTLLAYTSEKTRSLEQPGETKTSLKWGWQGILDLENRSRHAKASRVLARPNHPFLRSK